MGLKTAGLLNLRPNIGHSTTSAAGLQFSECGSGGGEIFGELGAILG